MLAKPLIAFVLFFGFAADALSCSITWITSTDLVQKVMDESDGFTFADYDAVCEKLENANAALTFSGDATVLRDRAIAWAMITVRDRDLKIETDEYCGMSTSADDVASMDRAQELLFEAINDAIDETTFDKAIASLDQARQAARAALRKTAK